MKESIKLGSRKYPKDEIEIVYFDDHSWQELGPTKDLIDLSEHNIKIDTLQFRKTTKMPWKTIKDYFY